VSAIISVAVWMVGLLLLDIIFIIPERRRWELWFWPVVVPVILIVALVRAIRAALPQVKEQGHG
jgi:hypothetical protein